MPADVAASADACNASPTSMHTSAYVVCCRDDMVPGSPRMCIKTYGTPKRATCSPIQPLKKGRECQMLACLGVDMTAGSSNS